MTPRDPRTGEGPKVREGFTLGLDLDGVCADYVAGFRAHVAKAFGVEESTLGVVDHWDFTNIGWGIVSRQHYESLHLQAVREGMFRTLPPVPGVSRALWQLSDAGVHIRVVTHRLFIKGAHEQSAGDTIGWLEGHNIPYRDICMIADKVKVGADLYLDDSPTNVEKLRAAGADVVIFDQPYNRHVEGQRVRTWDEALELILEKAKP